MFVLFTLGADLEFQGRDGIDTEWVSYKAFVQIEDQTNDEIRYAWNLAENSSGLEVIDFEFLTEQEYAERFVSLAADVVGMGGDTAMFRALWPRTFYEPEVA